MNTAHNEASTTTTNEEGTDCTNCSNVVYDDYELCNECRFISEGTLEEWFNDALDECNSDITIGTLTYDPSQVLKAVDPVAYRIGLSEHADYLEREGYFVEGYSSHI
jgi:hypothetical protein